MRTVMKDKCTWSTLNGARYWEVHACSYVQPCLSWCISCYSKQGKIKQMHMWQSHVEIKDYSVEYFNCVAAFKALYHWTQHIHTSTKHISVPPCKFSDTVLWMQWCDQNMRRNNLQISTRDCHKQYFNLCHLHCSWMPCLKMAPWHCAVTVILLHCCTSRSRWMKVSLKTSWDYTWLRQHLECSCTSYYLLLIRCILSTTIRHLATAWAKS